MKRTGQSRIRGVTDSVGHTFCKDFGPSGVRISTGIMTDSMNVDPELSTSVGFFSVQDEDGSCREIRLDRGNHPASAVRMPDTGMTRR